MRNAGERLYDEFRGYITEKKETEKRIQQLLAVNPNADTTSSAMLITDLERKIQECHEQARKLGTSLY